LIEYVFQLIVSIPVRIWKIHIHSWWTKAQTRSNH